MHNLEHFAVEDLFREQQLAWERADRLLREADEQGVQVSATLSTAIRRVEAHERVETFHEPQSVPPDRHFGRWLSLVAAMRKTLP